MANEDHVDELSRQRAVFSSDALFLLPDHGGINTQKDGINCWVLGVTGVCKAAVTAAQAGRTPT